MDLIDELLAAAHRLRRNPAFALGAGLSLALGMSLATAVFSMVDAVFLRPLPYPYAERLVHLYEIVPGTRASRWSISARHFTMARDDVHSFASVAAWRFSTPPAVIGSSGDARSYGAVSVTPNFFDVLGVRPMLGRSFAADDARLEAASPVILSSALWQSRFGGARDIVGKIIDIDGTPRTVIGVMPATFDFPSGIELWYPLSDATIVADAASPDDIPMYAAIARLVPGATPDGATAELRVAFHNADDATRGASDQFRPLAMPLTRHVTMDYRELATIWIAAALAVVILCAVNFATLSLARGMRRRGEIAIRAAMGATPSRLIVLLGSEGMLISLAAGALSVLFAYWFIRSSSVWLSGSLAVGATIDWRTIAFGVLLTTIVGSVCAVVPAIDLSRTDLRSVLSGDAGTLTSGTRELRGRRALVALQVALALICVSAIGTFVQIARRAESRGPGYDYARMVTAHVFIRDSAARAGSVQTLSDYLRVLPSVASAAVVRSPELVATLWLPPGRKVEAAIVWRDVTPDYFRTLNIHPIAGRLPTPAEYASLAPIALVSETAARYLGIEHPADAVGQRIRWRSGRQMIWLTIVGVMPDVRFGPEFAAMSEPIYTVGAVPANLPHETLFIRLRGDAAAGLPALAKTLRGLDSRIVITDLSTVGGQVERWSVLSRGRGLFLSMVGAFTLVLAMMGVYGLTSFTTELRARELGIRIALGANAARLARTLGADLWQIGCIGVIAGWFVSGRVAALAGSYLIEARRPVDLIAPTIMPTVIAAIALAVITVVGTITPMRRLLRMDVMRIVQSN